MAEIMAASITAGKARMMSQILTVAASSAPSWSFLSRFWGSLTVIQWAAIVATGILTIGAINEYWVKIKLLTLLGVRYLLGKSTPFDRCIFRKVFIHSIDPILVVLGIAGEVVFEGRAFILEDSQEQQARNTVGSLKDQAAEVKLKLRADEKQAAALKKQLDLASTQIGTLSKETADANNSASQLRIEVEEADLLVTAMESGHTFRPHLFGTLKEQRPANVTVIVIEGANNETKLFGEKLSAALSGFGWKISPSGDWSIPTPPGITIRNKWYSGVGEGHSTPYLEVDPYFLQQAIMSSGGITLQDADRLAVLALALDAGLEKNPDLDANSLEIIIAK
jgi:hypothetical protein